MITPLSNWLDVQQLVEAVPALTEGALRRQLRDRDENGLAAHIRRIGKKHFIDREGYADWINAHSA